MVPIIKAKKSQANCTRDSHEVIAVPLQVLSYTQMLQKVIWMSIPWLQIQ